MGLLSLRDALLMREHKIGNLPKGYITYRLQSIIKANVDLTGETIEPAQNMYNKLKLKNTSFD